MIKKYLGITGFLICFIGVSICCYSKFYYDDDLEPIWLISFLIWITTHTLSNELNKKIQKKWLIRSIIGLSSLMLITIIYVYFIACI